MTKRKGLDLSQPGVFVALAASVMGLPPGNMWEPGVELGIKQELAQGRPFEEIKRELWFSWFGESYYEKE